MLQIALAGYQATGSSVPDVDGYSTVTFYEPDFNLYSKLEYEMNNAAIVNFYFRERADSSGTLFLDNELSDYTLTTTDATTGAVIRSVLYEGTYLNALTGEVADPYASFFPGQIDVFVGEHESHKINIHLVNNTTGSEVRFQLINIESLVAFSYLQVDRSNFDFRSATSTEGSANINITVGDKGSYVLVAPYASLTEVTGSDFDFAYPNSNVKYNRASITSSEGYIFEIDTFGSDFLTRSVDINNVPGYAHVGVLNLSPEISTRLMATNSSAFFNIRVTGAESLSQDVFVVQLSSKNLRFKL